MKKNNKKKIIYFFIGIILFIAIWSFISLKINSEIIFPSIDKIFLDLVNIISQKDFYSNLLYTFIRVIITFVLSFLLAITFGIIAGIFKSVRYILMPIINFIRTIPTIPLILIAVLWFNNNLVPIFVSLFVIFPIIYDAVVNGIINIDKNLIEMSNSYNVSFKNQLISLYIPSIKPYILTSISQSMGMTWKSVLASEIITLPTLGLGTKLYESHLYLNTVSLFAYCLIAIIFNIIFEIIMRLQNDL